MAEYNLDAKGLVLPLALVRLKQAIDCANSGDTVCFDCDADGVGDALEHFLTRTGHEVCSHETSEGCESVTIRKC